MRKIFVSLVCIAVVIILMASACFAAPEHTGIFDAGGTDGMITITNPQKAYSTTYSKTCLVSGFAQPGAKLYVYYLDAGEGLYDLYYENGEPLLVSAGASGMFVIPLKLSQGSNNIIIRAEKGEEFQNANLHINVLSASMFSIKSGLMSYKFN